MTKNNEPWRPRPGALVQIWDYTNSSDDTCIAPRIAGHGSVGYVVKRSGGTDSYDPLSAGPIFEVICFNNENGSERHNVWHGWLREIKKTSDIKKVVDLVGGN